MSSSPSPPTH